MQDERKSAFLDRTIVIVQSQILCTFSLVTAVRIIRSNVPQYKTSLLKTSKHVHVYAMLLLDKVGIIYCREVLLSRLW